MSTDDGTIWTNKLYFGDNLDIMREFIDDESVDLIFRKKLEYPRLAPEATFKKDE